MCEARPQELILSQQDRPWNDPGPPRGKALDIPVEKPTLKAVILDFSSVNNVDITSVQQLIDVRNQLDRYTSPEVVEWHFACINNRWTKRALVAAGFGSPPPQFNDGEGFKPWKPRRPSRPNDVETAHHKDGLDGITTQSRPAESSSPDSNSLEEQITNSKAYGTMGQPAKRAVVHGVNRPLFHMDLTNALQAAITSARGKEAFEKELALKPEL